MNQRRRWRESAQEWIAWARPAEHDHYFYEFNLPAFLTLVPSGPGRCLDVGCGEGRAGRAVTQTGYDVVGLDGAPVLAAAAASHSGGFPSAVGDAACLPFRDACFDLAIAFMALHDVDDLADSLDELARVLRPDGILCAAIVHPMFSSGHVGLSDRVTRHSSRLGYFRTTPYQETVTLNGRAVTLHSVHRPLQDHVTGLAGAGFVLEVMQEPEPSSDYLKAHPEAAPLADSPLYLHYRARRDATAKKG